MLHHRGHGACGHGVGDEVVRVRVGPAPGQEEIAGTGDTTVLAGALNDDVLRAARVSEEAGRPEDFAQGGERQGAFSHSIAPAP
jgi:hypothetical protein